MSPDQVLRNYFHAKDENRPHLLADVFSSDARLEIRNRTDQISFPATTVGREGIEDVLVRRFNQAYENIYSFYLGRPEPTDESFSCDWMVGMTDKDTRAARIGCGRYDWTFSPTPAVRATRLVVTIEAMLVLDRLKASEVLAWLTELEYPWTRAADVLRALPGGDLDPVRAYISRERDPTF